MSNNQILECTLNKELLHLILMKLWKQHKKRTGKKYLYKHSFFMYCQKELVVYAKDYYRLGSEIKEFFDNNDISHQAY